MLLKEAVSTKLYKEREKKLRNKFSSTEVVALLAGRSIASSQSPRNSWLIGRRNDVYVCLSPELTISLLSFALSLLVEDGDPATALLEADWSTVATMAGKKSR